MEAMEAIEELRLLAQHWPNLKFRAVDDQGIRHTIGSIEPAHWHSGEADFHPEENGVAGILFGHVRRGAVAIEVIAGDKVVASYTLEAKVRSDFASVAVDIELPVILSVEAKPWAPPHGPAREVREAK